MQVRFGSHSKVQHSITTVSWLWTTLVKMKMPCTVWLTILLAVDLLTGNQPKGTGSFPTKLKFLALVMSGTSTEQEIIWRYFCTGGEVERMEFTAVWYLIERVMSRPHILECTQQALVSGTYILVLMLQKSETLCIYLSVQTESHYSETHLVDTPQLRTYAIQWTLPKNLTVLPFS